MQANLRLDLSRPMTHMTEYGGPNMTLTGPLWEAIEFDPGLVALPYEWTDKKGLPRGQKFPWDTSKGIYVLNGYHNLHCLKVIHLYLTEVTLQKPTTYPLAHITHCLDNLRLDVLCQADDTPRYTSDTVDHENGVGQQRQCRDWSKLTTWAKSHNACYRYLNASADEDNEMERYKFCPEDSPYLPQVREYFGLARDWVPT
ncbi:hypothetical protein MMC17_006411 [Xylographa soralifera]|nr:hypothetical protein [Xylographa soralifera]